MADIGFLNRPMQAVSPVSQLKQTESDPTRWFRRLSAAMTPQQGTQPQSPEPQTPSHSQLICGPDQQFGLSGQCVCKEHFVWVVDACKECPANSGTRGEFRNGWGDCFCNAGYGGLVTHELSECTPCGVDFYSIGSGCNACPSGMTTNGTSAQSSCMCAESTYLSDQKSCVSCPPMSHSRVNSKKLSDCVCLEKGSAHDFQNGVWVCAPARGVSTPKMFLNKLVQVKQNALTTLCGTSDACYPVNRARLMLRWIYLIILSTSMFTNFITLFKGQHPSEAIFVSLLLCILLSVYDMSMDLLMTTTEAVGFLSFSLVYGFIAVIAAWANIATQNFDLKDNVTPVEVVLSADPPKSTLQSAVVLAQSRVDESVLNANRDQIVSTQIGDQQSKSKLSELQTVINEQIQTKSPDTRNVSQGEELIVGTQSKRLSAREDQSASKGKTGTSTGGEGSDVFLVVPPSFHKIEWAVLRECSQGKCRAQLVNECKRTGCLFDLGRSTIDPPLREVRLLNPMHSHLVRFAPLYLTLAMGLMTVYALSADDSELTPDVKALVMCLAMLATVGGNNVYFAKFFASQHASITSTVLDVMAGVASVMIFMRYNKSGVFFALSVMCLSLMMPLANVVLQTNSPNDKMTPLVWQLLLPLMITGVNFLLAEMWNME